MDNLYGLPSLPLPHLGERQARGLGRATCEALVARIHVGGYRIENDRFPRIADERWVRLTLLQHLPELVDVRTSREMWMLYTSVRPEAGPAVGLWTGGAGHRHRQHGGRPDIPGHPEVPALGWEERARDPRLARCWSGDIVTHSPEGRMRRGFLARPGAREWGQEAPLPRTAWLAARLGGLLSAGARPWFTVGLIVSAGHRAAAIATAATITTSQRFWAAPEMPGARATGTASPSDMPIARLAATHQLCAAAGGLLPQGSARPPVPRRAAITRSNVTSCTSARDKGAAPRSADSSPGEPSRGARHGRARPAACG